MIPVQLGAPTNTTQDAKNDWFLRSLRRLEAASLKNDDQPLPLSVPLLVGTAPYTLYVAPSFGSDANDGSSYTPGSALKTLTTAWKLATNICCDDVSWIEIVIEPSATAGNYTAPASYSGFRFGALTAGGSANPFIRIRPQGFPSDYSYAAPTANIVGASSAGAIGAWGGATYVELFGLKISNPTGTGITSNGGAYVATVGCEIGACVGGWSQMVTSGGGIDHYTKLVISGNSNGAMYSDTGGTIWAYNETNFAGTPTFANAVAYCGVKGLIYATGAFTGVTPTGKRFNCDPGGRIYTANSSLTYIPGTTAGSFYNGGFYNDIPGCTAIRIGDTGIDGGIDAASGAAFQLAGLSAGVSRMQLGMFTADADDADFAFYKTRGTTIGGAHATVLTGDALGNFLCKADDGTNWLTAGQIKCLAEGTVGTGFVPSRWEFRTANAAGTLSRRMIVDSAGYLHVTPDETAGNCFAHIGQMSNGATFAGVGFSTTAQGTFSSTTYSLLGDGTNTYLNALTGGSLFFRVNNNAVFGPLDANSTPGATYTPVVTAGTFTYTLQQGRYIRIGKLVWVAIRVKIATASGQSGSTTFSLPFACANNMGGNQYTSMAVYLAGVALPASCTQFTIVPQSGSATATLFASGSSTGITGVPATSCIANSDFYISGVYECA